MPERFRAIDRDLRADLRIAAAIVEDLRMVEQRRRNGPVFRNACGFAGVAAIAHLRQRTTGVGRRIGPQPAGIEDQARRSRVVERIRRGGGCW